MEKRTYTVSIIEAVLTHLRKENIPPKGDDETFRAMPMDSLFACFLSCLIMCDRTTTHKNETVKRIIGQIEGILGWISCFLKFAIRTFTMSDLAPTLSSTSYTVLRLLSLDGDLTDAVLRSPSTAEALLDHLSAPLYDIRGKPLYVLEDDDDRSRVDPTLALLQEYPRNPAGWSILTSRILASRFTTMRFCEGYLGRMERLPKLGALGLHPNTLAQDFGALYYTLGQFISTPKIHQEFRRQRILTRWVRTVLDLEMYFMPEHTFLFLSHIFRASYQPGSNPVKGFEEVLEAGIFYPLMSAMTKLPSHRQDYRKVVDCIAQALLAFGYHPRTAKRLRRDFEEHISLWRRQCPPLMDPGQWKELQYRLKGLTSLASIPKTICDSQDHVDTGTDQKDDSRECSGCRMVVYCSAKCQQDDWRRRHRKECRQMCITYLERKDNHLVLSQASRAIVSRYIRVMVIGTIVSLEQDTKRRFPDRPSNATIIILNLAGDPGWLSMVSSLSLETYLIDRPNLVKPESPEHEARANGIIERFKDDKTGKRKLVVAFMAYNHEYRISNLIELENFGDKPGMLRFGESVVQFERRQGEGTIAHKANMAGFLDRL
ncbi:hypothetical protein CC2G_003528 [Coprinopsis cinerea AmutBmut pab1-1]|nr:hypothetical protein CC2G_003528 [Coprinopsis cinerea AmutBmut pab1-1]